MHVKHEGHWVDITAVGLTADQVRAYHRMLYGTAIVPKEWLFNDFGHMTCYLYRDQNRNGRRDRNEPLHGEFIHTTPVDEAAARRALNVKLVESHGCVHVKPADMDDMIRRRFLAKNTLVMVHRYSEIVVPFGRARAPYKGPIELHFFPGAHKVCVVANSQP